MMDLSKYDGKNYSELKALFEEKYGSLNHNDGSLTFFCPEAKVVMINGELIAYDEITEVYVCHSKDYVSDVYGSYECEESITASIDGYYNEDSKSSTVYDYDYIEESSCISVDYNRDGIKGTARARIRGRQYWLENLVEFVVEKAGEKKKKVAFEYQMQPGGNLVKRKKKDSNRRCFRRKWLEKHGYIKDTRSTLQKVKDAVSVPFLIILLFLGKLLLFLGTTILFVINIFRMRSFKDAFADAKRKIKEDLQ